MATRVAFVLAFGFGVAPVSTGAFADVRVAVGVSVPGQEDLAGSISAKLRVGSRGPSSRATIASRRRAPAFVFEENRGQSDLRVSHLARWFGHSVFLSANEVVQTFANPRLPPVRMRLEGADARAGVRGESPLDGRVNYLRGRDPATWITGVRTYSTVRYTEVYPGIDVVYYSREGRLEYDFVVAPDANPDSIRIDFAGAEGLASTADGVLAFDLDGVRIVQRPPVVYQVVDGERRFVDGRYRIDDEGTVRFEIGVYDPALALVIDPILDWSTYVGGRGSETAFGTAVDAEGYVYVAGVTRSRDFPGPLGAGTPPTWRTLGDAFVTKLMPDGSGFVYTTYLGGSRTDEAHAVAVDARGSVYLAGTTRSQHDFPVVAALQPEHSGQLDAFVTRIDPTGAGIDFSTLLGGSRRDEATTIALAANGDVIVGGGTSSRDDFPLAHALQPMHGGSQDGFVVRLAEDGSELVFSTYLGGSGSDQVNGVAVDSGGHVHVTGVTRSTRSFPLVGAFQAESGGNGDAFVARIDPDGGALGYSTYLGGEGADEGRDIAVDALRRAHVAGVTRSRYEFPLVSPLQAEHAGERDAFVARLAVDGSSIERSTYFGGAERDEAVAISLDASGGAWIAGFTDSEHDFPEFDAVQSGHGGRNDAFVARLDLDGDALTFSTLLGGSRHDEALALALDTSGNPVVVGVTASRRDFPLADAVQPVFGGGGRDAFVARLSFNQAPVITSTPATDAEVGEAYLYDVEAADPENDPLAYSLDEAPAGMAIDAVSGGVTYAPGAPGEFAVVVRVEDEFGGTDTQAFTLTVTEDNSAPVIVSAPVTKVEEGADYVYHVEATDADLDPLFYVLTVAPAGMAIDAVAGVISWIPDATGDYPVVVRVEDGQGGLDSQSFTVTVQANVAPVVVVDTPVDGSIVSEAQQLFTGSVSEAATLTLNGESVVVNADLTFTHGPVTLAEGSNGFLLVATDGAGNQGVAFVGVTLDTAGPIVTVTAPADGSAFASAAVGFTGTVSEPVVLTIAGQGVAVSPDGAFAATVTLAEGANAVAVVALDAAGNETTVTVNVTVDTTPPIAPDVSLVNRSSPSPRVIGVVGTAGAAEAGVLVTVTNPTNGFVASVLSGSDGGFTTEVAGFANETLALVAVDALGNASASVALGPATPPALTLDAIGDKTAPLGRETRFTVTANDAGGGPVTLGVTPLPLPAGMRFNRASGELVYVPALSQVGSFALTFSAATPSERVTETITVTVPAPVPGAPTDFTARVLDANAMEGGQLVPLVGATVAFLGTGIAAVTDANGFVTLTGLPSGGQVLDIDASTAAPGPGGVAYASFREAFTLVANVENVVDRPFYLPRIDAASLTTVDPAQTTVVTNPTLGITLTVPPGTAVNDADGTLYTGPLSISLVPRNLAPANLPEHLDFAQLITIQPVGVSYTTPVAITFASDEALVPGNEVEIWSVDPDLGRFVVVGIGVVSADGSVIETVSGGIRANDWHSPGPGGPNPNPGGAQPQSPHNPCNSCPSEPGGSSVSLHDGHVSTALALPVYRSLEASRGLRFSYRSHRANPRPVVEYAGLVAQRFGVPPTVSYAVSVAGVAQGEEVYLSTAGFDEETDEPFQVGLTFDASDFDSGLYPYRLRVTNHFSSRISTFAEGVVLIENETTSPFGAGWMLEGLFRLAFNSDASVTLLAPSARTVTYEADAVIPDAFVSPSNDYATLAREADGTYTHTEKDGTVMRFASDGRLAERVDRNGNVTGYVYDAQGRVRTLTDPVGRVTTLDYDINGRIATVADPAGRISRFEHDVTGNLTKVTYPDDTFESFEYDARHLMTAHEDERGNRWEDRYDAFGRLAEATLPDGSTRAATGKTASALIDVSSGAGTPSNPAPAPRPADVAGAYTDARGNPSRRVLDPHGRATMALDEVGRLTLTERDPDSNPTKTTRPNGSVVDRTFDTQGNVLTATEQFNGAVTTYTYDAFSLVTSVTNPRGHTTIITRDPQGNPEAIENHLGHTTTMEYDTRGLVTRMETPNGLVTTYSYNAEGLMESMTETPPVGSPGAVRVTTYAYHPTGLLAQVVTPDGIILDYAYDERSRLASVTDQLGQSIGYIYDARGNVTATETHSAGGSLALLVQSVYDLRNRLTETRMPHDAADDSVTTRLLDANSNLEGLVDPNGALSTNVYDAANRLTENTHRLNGVTTYEYDERDRITTVIAPNGATTTYSYDLLGRRLTENSPDRGTLTYTYDLANNVTTITDGRGITATLTYDELERPLTKTYPNTIPGKDESVAYVYDACPLGVGRLCERTDESGTTAYQYDAWGNVTVMDFTEAGGVAYETTYVYDEGDRVIQTTLPSGRVIDLTRDGVRRLQAVDTTVNGVAQSIVSGIEYRGDDRMTACTFGNGLEDTRTYDLQGRLTHQVLSTPGGGIVDERTYTHDKNANILGIDTDFEDNAYAYDALDRLTDDGVSGEPDVVYTYDANDNRQTRTSADGSETTAYAYTPGSNRLVESNTVSGLALPPVDVADRRFVYNDAGRLYQVIDDGVVRAAYVYNDAGQRTRKTRQAPDGTTTTTVYHYDIAGRPVSETDEFGDPRRDYVWSDDLTSLAQVDINEASETLDFLHTDHLMTPRLATDGLQSIEWRWEGRVFGETEAQEVSGTTINLRFPGQYFDDEGEFSYNWKRFYAPDIARYTASDPFGLVGGTNTYGYARANPNYFIDSSGEFINLGLAGFGALIGAVAAGTSTAISGGDIGAVARAAAIGGITGTLAGLTFGASSFGLAGAVATGAVAGAVGESIGQGVAGIPTDASRIGAAALIGAGSALYPVRAAQLGVPVKHGVAAGATYSALAAFLLPRSDGSKTEDPSEQCE